MPRIRKKEEFAEDAPVEMEILTDEPEVLVHRPGNEVIIYGSNKRQGEKVVVQDVPETVEVAVDGANAVREVMKGTTFSRETPSIIVFKPQGSNIPLHVYLEVPKDRLERAWTAYKTADPEGTAPEFMAILTAMTKSEGYGIIREIGYLNLC